MEIIVAIWIGAVSAVTFVLFGVDKYRAKKNLWRIPERVLLTVCALGGGLGGLLGMRLFRHKTKHWKFLIGVPLCLGINLAAAYFLLRLF